jgi:hypothetical protein
VWFGWLPAEFMGSTQPAPADAIVATETNLNQNTYFSGGAGQSTMSPVVLAATLIAALLVLLLPRKYAIAPILVVTFLTPFGQQLNAGGFHLFVIRIMVLAGALRLLGAKFFSDKPLFPGGLNGLDRVFCLWAFVRGLAFILLYREGAAVANQMGFWLDAFGVYFLSLHLLQDREDVLRALKVFAFVAAILAATMSYEYLTQVNLFSYVGGSEIVPWTRGDRVRAQGVFGNSITAGAFGATLLPLFFWLWKSGKAKLWGVVGMAASTLVALTSVASTPITGYLAGILALGLWPIRRRMRWVRWGIVFAVTGLAFEMKAPVWFVINRINVAGGASWDRANLIDQTVRHFSDWWLFGSKTNAKWGYFTWDQCNQFVNEGLQGGAATLFLFLVLLRRGFGAIGKYRKQVEGDPQEWFSWCLAAALFAHVIVFMGIDYFDQTRTLWFIFLAMISVATLSVSAVPLTAPQLDLRRSPVQFDEVPALGMRRAVSHTAAAEPSRPAPSRVKVSSQGSRVR